jgi:hypothetical protein
MKRKILIALTVVVAVSVVATAGVLVSASIERADAANAALTQQLEEEKQARLDDKRQREAEEKAQELEELREREALTEGYKDVTRLEPSVRSEINQNAREEGLPRVKDIGCVSENERNTRFTCHLEYRDGFTSTLTVTVEPDGSAWVSRSES